MILLPRGTVVRLAARVTPGQEVMLTSLKTKQQVHCKVVSVRPSETPRGYVELEFTQRTAKFWGGTAHAPKAATSTGGSANPAAKAGAEQIAAALKTPPGSGLQSSFDATIQPTLPLAAVKPTRMEDLPVRRVPSADVAKRSTANFQASPLSAPERRSPAASMAPNLGIHTAKNRMAGDLHTGRKWILTGTVIAAVILGLAGGIYLFESHAASAASTPAVANQAVSQAPAANDSPQVIVVRANEEAPATQPAAAAKSSAMSEAFHKAAAKLHLRFGDSKIAAPSPARAPIAPATDEPPAIAADDSAATGPAALANETSIGALSGGSAAIPVPAAPPDPTVKAAGPATRPRSISTVRPQYPAAARSSRIEGDVTIQADIDAAGKVTGMKVISGPAILQTAALDALREWKYEPASLDGQPVAGQVLVTLKFRLE
jgi:TonB family protein